jgi:hypothetical protein
VKAGAVADLPWLATRIGASLALLHRSVSALASCKIHPAWSRSALLAACVVLTSPTQAARPMATDDTSTAAAGECQIEAWGERDETDRAQVLAPACGLTDALELDTAASRLQGGGRAVDGAAVGLKWVPSAAATATALGTVRFGLEGGLFWVRGATGAWRRDSLAVLGLSSLSFAGGWNLYANLGTTLDLATDRHATELRMALAWQPDERWLLFIEALADDRGSRLRNAGLRLWAVPEVLGLDLVAVRAGTGSGSVTSFSLGLGWYGLKWP